MLTLSKKCAVELEVVEGVAWLTFAASENTINRAFVSDLKSHLLAIQTDQTCRAVIIRAEGNNFCKGLDLEEISHLEQFACPELLLEFLDCLKLIVKLTKPVIAHVQGAAMGGGVGLASACDIVIAEENASFSLPEVLVGMIPAIVTPFLLRRLSLSRIHYMTISSLTVGAMEAYNWGLVDQVVKTDEANKAIRQHLQRLFRSSPLALAASKEYFWRLHQSELENQSEQAVASLSAWLSQEKVLEDIEKFNQGEMPSWFVHYKGR